MSSAAADNRRIGGIIADGTGSRPLALTVALNRLLLPVYDKPMIFYPLTRLIQACLRVFVVVSSPTTQPVWLWSSSDDAAQHVRSYGRDEMGRKLV
jgi:dTDP-glucose pyrophosphorylase